MPYTTGSAADMGAVKTALVNACTSDGWTEQTDAGGKTVLSKSGCYVRVESTVDDAETTWNVLQLLGRTGLDSGDAPGVVSIGDHNDQNGDVPISYPVTYHIFTFSTPPEVFMVINYSDYYQWTAFGQSSQNGLPGTGNWVAALFGETTRSRYDPIVMDESSGGYTYYSSGASPGGFFWGTQYADGTPANGWIHNDFETTYPWALGNGSDYASPVGIQYLTELIKTQPNDYNLETVLLPIRTYKKRPESKVSQLLEAKNVRHIRIDNYAPEETITLGTEEWMLFPYFRKNTESRSVAGIYDGMHSGTFGWAIKKV